MADTIYGWVTLVEAETYMATRLGATKHWYSGVSKAAALQTAYNQLISCGLFDFPETAISGMKNAQCEMALFLLQHQEDADARMGLQAQGVTQAGIVQETYNLDNVDGIPIPLIVRSMLQDYESASPIHIVDLEREESEDAL